MLSSVTAVSELHFSIPVLPDPAAPSLGLSCWEEWAEGQKSRVGNCCFSFSTNILGVVGIQSGSCSGSQLGHPVCAHHSDSFILPCAEK